MAAVYEDRSDGYGGAFAWSPEGPKITNQPQSLDVNNPGDSPAGCQHVKKIPFNTVTHDGTGHVISRPPLDCFQCGQDVATILSTQLSLGVKTDFESNSPFQFRDVMVLTPDARISDVSGMVQGLRDARIPVRVVGEEEADVITGNVADVNEVLVAWQGLAGSGTNRRVLVLLPAEGAEPQSSLNDVIRQAEHVIWVKPPVANGAIADDLPLDMEDGVALEAVGLLETEDHHHHHHHTGGFQDGNGPVDEGKASVGEEEVVLGVTQQHFRDKADDDIHAVTHAPYHRSYPPPRLPATNGEAKNRNRGGHSSYNPNNCCDNLCLACSYDVGESGCIVCCPCCGDLGAWCNDCCRGFGESLNGCVQMLCCGCSCCSGDGGSGCDCGDCDCDCGDCNCDCGDCNCDCGSCTIM